MGKFSDYIKMKRASGYLSFSSTDAYQELGVSPRALINGIYTLKKRGEIISPAKHLFVIIPPEYQALGSLPADWLVPILMQHLKLPYYTCLLSAAMYHGASHQQPQVFQVMTTKQRPALQCGQIHIQFLYKKSLAALPFESRTVYTGELLVSSPELTAMDLLTYLHAAGGLNAVATVLGELLEAIDLDRLKSLLEQSTRHAWQQRLGYMLSKIDSWDEAKQQEIITLLREHLAQKKLLPVALAAELPTEGCARDPVWKIIENTSIESDL